MTIREAGKMEVDFQNRVIENEVVEDITNDNDDDVNGNHTNGNPARKEYAVSVRWEREQAGEIDAVLPKCHALNALCCQCATPIGGMFVLCQHSDGEPIVMAGPLWSFCMFVTCPLVLFISGVFFYFVLLNDEIDLPDWLTYIYLILVIVTMSSLFMVSCRNPGLMERERDMERGRRDGWYWNEQVESYRPAHARYCSECKVRFGYQDTLKPIHKERYFNIDIFLQERSTHIFNLLLNTFFQVLIEEYDHVRIFYLLANNCIFIFMLNHSIFILSLFDSFVHVSK